MKCEVYFVKFTQIDQDSPEIMVLHQFSGSRKFTISVPLLLGFQYNPANYVAMINMVKNKRAYVEYAEFFLHGECHCPNYSQFSNYLLCLK